MGRRMFSTRITTSARFLKLPPQAQALYFHLGMNADDDGIVEAFNVVRLTGCSEDDLDLLETKGFVKVLNEDLVTYIIDWSENNLIRADRKVDSIYQDLLKEALPDVQLLEKKERSDTKNNANDNQSEGNGQTTDEQQKNDVPTVDGPWTDNGPQMDRIREDKRREDNIIQDNTRQSSISLSSLAGENDRPEDPDQTDIQTDTPAEITPIVYQQVLDLYREKCPSLAKATSLTDSRKQKIDTLLDAYTLDDIAKAFEKAEGSSFLSKKFHTNIDFLLTKNYFVKTLNGEYDDFSGRDSPDGNPKAAAGIDSKYKAVMGWFEKNE